MNMLGPVYISVLQCDKNTNDSLTGKANNLS